MKSKIVLVLVLTMLLLLPISVSAKTDVLLDCNNMKCDLKVSTNEKINSFAAKIKLPEGLKVKNINKTENWNGQVEDNYITVYSDEDKTGDIDIASFNLITSNNIIDDGKVTITSITYSDSNYNEHVMDDVSKEIDVTNSSSSSSPYLPIGIAAGVVVLGAIIIVATKKKR